jgi:AcrR family transcriptional regulator
MRDAAMEEDMATSRSSDTQAGEGDAAKSWRERSVERSIQNARAKAMSRSERFIRAAEAIMLETGSTDFTVQELVERARTSLRSFYQHFSNREELLLAVFEEVLGNVATEMERQIDASESPLDGLRVLLRHTTGGAGTPRGQLLNRAFSTYHRQLAQSNPDEYVRILAPLYGVVIKVVRRGVEAGEFRKDLEPDAMAVLMTQTLLAGGQMYALGASIGQGSGLNVDAVFEFFSCGLIGHQPSSPAPAKRTAKKAAAKAK